MDITKFITARLDEWEGQARQALPLQTGSRDEGQPPEHVSWRRSAGHPEFALRHVATLRAIVAMYEGQDGYNLPEGVSEGRDDDERLRDEGIRDALGEVVFHLAADFSTHPDYDPAWA